MTWADITKSVQSADRSRPLVLRNARVPQCMLSSGGASVAFAAVDLTIERGSLTQLDPVCARTDDGIDLGQRIVWPTTVDCHTHIDKGHVWPRSPNPDGSFNGALCASGADFAAHQTPKDVRCRADFALACAYAHGTALLRTHVDASPDSFDARFGVLKEVAQDWSDRITVQLCPFSGALDDPAWLARLAQAAKTTAHPTLSFFLQAHAGLASDLDTVVQYAADHDLNLDFHADETLDPASNCLEEVADAVLRNGFERPVLVGHCCSLSVHDADTVARMLDTVAKTAIGIVALPLCNMYLQDRQAHVSPRQRGIAPLKEIKARGIPVAIASDNTRDAFYAYGDLDMPDVFRDALRMMQLDHPVGDWPATVSGDAAAMIGVPEMGQLRVGMPADLILFSARNWSEFAARPQHDRIVLRDGLPIDTNPPEFADLDMLEGMTP